MRSGLPLRRFPPTDQTLATISDVQVYLTLGSGDVARLYSLENTPVGVKEFFGGIEAELCVEYASFDICFDGCPHFQQKLVFGQDRKSVV
jgi:hypothetical protein